MSYFLFKGNNDRRKNISCLNKNSCYTDLRYGPLENTGNNRSSSSLKLKYHHPTQNKYDILDQDSLYNTNHYGEQYRSEREATAIFSKDEVHKVILDSILFVPTDIVKPDA